ncbi:MAG: hypothetical protein F6K65_14360, partial [Moorea sp. SIO3C2]|nr:hypothetical protein [Moorena sp. SIO3C2]
RDPACDHSLIPILETTATHQFHLLISPSPHLPISICLSPHLPISPSPDLPISHTSHTSHPSHTPCLTLRKKTYSCGLLPAP